MHRFGISIYPEHSTKEKDYEYMRVAASFGFSRIFTCLLSVQKPKEEIINEFGEFVSYAHELGYIVGVDTSPEVFTHLGATPLDLKPFADMGVDIVRLDGHFSDREDIAITHNTYGILIEFNGSSNASLDLMMERGADKHNMVVCHNFYPQKYTGLSYERFMAFTTKYRDMGLSVSAFVSSNNEKTFGPWEVYDGLPTCELLRGLPIDFQTRFLLATGCIDDILIGNAYATTEELKAMSSVDTSKIMVKMEAISGLTEIEHKIINHFVHFDRVDTSEYIIRSSITRETYKQVSIPYRPCDKKEFQKGDVLVVNDNLKHYRGELQIVRTCIPNTGERNYVGRIEAEELMLLQFLKPEYLFALKAKF